MKVTLVAHYLDEAVGHGMARYCWNLLRELERSGIEMKAIYCDPKGAGPRKSAVDFFLSIPFKSISARPESDIYHFTVPQAGLSIPLFKIIRRKKVVSTIYDLHPIIFQSHHKAFPLIGRAIGTACKSSDHLIAISSLTKKDIVEHFGISPDKVTVTPLGVDPRFRPLGKKKSEIFTIGYIGSFAANKNVPVLLRAYSIFRKSHDIKSRLLIYGKGAQFDECVRLAKELGLPDVEFRGFADDKDLAEIYNGFDLFVFPSFAEGFGLPIVEAQKCRVPVIVKADARIPEEVTRFCLKADDEEHMAALMAAVHEKGFTFSPEQLKHLEMFTWARCAEQTISAYKALL